MLTDGIDKDWKEISWYLDKNKLCCLRFCWILFKFGILGVRSSAMNGVCVVIKVSEIILYIYSLYCTYARKKTWTIRRMIGPALNRIHTFSLVYISDHNNHERWLAHRLEASTTSYSGPCTAPVYERKHVRFARSFVHQPTACLHMICF